MLLPVHLLLSALAAFNNCQIPGQFNSSEQLKLAAAQWFCLFQEALFNHHDYGHEPLQQYYQRKGSIINSCWHQPKVELINTPLKDSATPATILATAA
jgi:hypothetical protein